MNVKLPVLIRAGFAKVRPALDSILAASLIAQLVHPSCLFINSLDPGYFTENVDDWLCEDAGNGSDADVVDGRGILAKRIPDFVGFFCELLPPCSFVRND